ncbi:Zinc finger CCCH domain-containing protein [Melia azedarach]|uniref:Zinc finger CCCH domain-containing protein n=1 Tax=Melia azedarach TaxID=155640 RepID=A0ACC1X6F0_MELAZ|nr:Zinc finger CCCH domain-containing protein [Melia azedarach]
MLKDSNNNFYDFAEHPFCGLNLSPRQYSDAIDEAIYGSDEFRMFAYKIKRCTRTRSHDWTDCPYAHRGEKAQRRDPRKIPYCAIACPAFRNGKCYKGDSCEFAHGVFEYWLHPARYRTRACNSGRFCQRKVCFFAHTPDQLRAEGKHKCHYAYRPRMIPAGDNFMMGSGSGSSREEYPTSPMTPQYSPSPISPLKTNENCFDGVSEFLKSLRAMKIRDNNNGEETRGKSGVVGFEIPDSDLPNIEWISDLVE